MARISRKIQTIPNLSNQILYKVALYERLSREEYDTDATEKLSNQHELLLKYISDKPELNLVQVYQDNGRTGRNFDRESWKQLMEDIQNKKINCIIVKDLSRLGRNYIEVGTYLETIFPFLGVRVIAMNDFYDSNFNSNETEKNIYQLKNVVNDFYSKDLSKKIQTARKVQRERGEFTGNYVPYGYKRNPQKKGHFLVDENTCGIVKRIFLEIEQGKSYSQVAKQLNIEGVDSPRKYSKKCGLIDKNYIWTYQTICNIIKNPVYLGHMTQTDTLKKETITIYNTHEAIISQERFDNIQKLILNRNKGRDETISIDESDYLFHHLVYDAITEKKMVKVRYHTKNRVMKAYKSPKVYNQYGIPYPFIQIKEDTLISLVSSILNQYYRELVEVDIEKILHIQLTKLKGNIKQCHTEKENIKRKLFFLYEDMRKGIITEKNFLEYKHNYSHDIEIIELSLKKIMEEEANIKDKKNSSDFLKQWDKILTKENVAYFIEKINVFGSRKVEIIFSFQDIYEDMIHGKGNEIC